jgi:hypothetical protein
MNVTFSSPPQSTGSTQGENGPSGSNNSNTGTQIADVFLNQT